MNWSFRKIPLEKTEIESSPTTCEVSPLIDVADDLSWAFKQVLKQTNKSAAKADFMGF